MRLNKESMNTNNTSYKTILVPDSSIDAVKQKLGNDFIWNHDEKSNTLYLLQKSESNTDFLTELSNEVSANIDYENVPAQLTNRWDD